MIDSNEISTAALNRYKKVRTIYLSESLFLFCYKKLLPWWTKIEKRDKGIFVGGGILYFGIQFRIPTI